MSSRHVAVVFFVLCFFFSSVGCGTKKVSPESESTGREDVLTAGAEDAAANSSSDAFAEQTVHPDSMEGLNRKVFSFNDGFITYIFTPMNVVYTGFFPPEVRNGFSNFYANLAFPIRFVNALLQFKLDKVLKETASFALNTTFGSAGFFNVAEHVECLQASPEDFGQTLAFYGLGSGSYVVLPLLGPSSVRDTFGLVADSFLYPISWVRPDASRFALMAHDSGNKMSANMKAYQDIKAESFDHYTSMKDVYFQYREGLENK